MSSPAGLPVAPRVAEDAQHVVAQLERLPQRQAVPGQEALLSGGPRDGGAQLQGAFDRVLGRFVADDPLSGPDLLRDREDLTGRPGRGPGQAALGVDQVEVLPADHLRPQRGEQAEHRGQPLRAQSRVTQGGVGPGEGLQAEDERGRAAEPGTWSRPAVPASRASQPDVRGGLPAPDGRAVHQVVADQRAGVQELDRAAHPQGGVGVGSSRRASGGPVSPVDESRAEPLARTTHEAAQHVVECGDVGAEEIKLGQPPAEHRGQLGFDELGRPGHVGRCGGNLADLHSHDPAVLSAGAAGYAITRRFGPTGPGGCMPPPAPPSHPGDPVQPPTPPARPANPPRRARPTRGRSLNARITSQNWG